MTGVQTCALPISSTVLATVVPMQTAPVSAGLGGLAVPGIGLVAIGSALGVAEISRRPRVRRKQRPE